MGVPIYTFGKFVARPEYSRLRDEEREAAWWNAVAEIGKQGGGGRREDSSVVPRSGQRTHFVGSEEVHGHLHQVWTHLLVENPLSQILASLGTWSKTVGRSLDSTQTVSTNCLFPHRRRPKYIRFTPRNRSKTRHSVRSPM